MVDITPIIPADRQVIDGYGPGRFIIAGQIREGSVLVLPDRTMAWAVTDATLVTAADLEPILSATPKVEVLLLGTGAAMRLLPAAVRRDLKARGVIVDVMDTRAACRTYAVLLAEARRVAAALIPV